MTVWVKVLASGHRFQVQRDETILEGALRSGLNLNYHCSNGSCGECKARVLEGRIGDIQHHDYRLSVREKADGSVLLCRARPASDLVIDASEAGTTADIPLQKLTTQVHSVEFPVPDVATINLRTPRSQTLRFLAGQHVTLRVADLAPRNKSVASCPCNGMYLQFHQRRRPGDPFSDYVFTTLRNRQKIQVEGPYGGFVLDETSKRSLLFVAYDTGFSAIKSLIEHVISLDLPQPVRLYWITSCKEDQYYANYCRSWETALDDFRYIPLVADSMAANISGQSPTGIEQAMVRAASRILEDQQNLGNCDIYINGPQSIIYLTRKLFLERGLPEDRLFVDSIKRF